ncbi:unnamed protein product [Fusarium graminearum]|uniref:Chromosome 3, complete genome n=1 Tax=Gibberella zeae (strain ATCC MYA-4620 / CBS 123657 / FGSC 9075 / NRRL 31084 / PH-1) TaxID=229533 RepID=A0A098DXR0_GIBZE|nr:unnamed protein product [Fusarium graminearum]CZS86210.1 unnamed protein product [Fusarium graminearum]
MAEMSASESESLSVPRCTRTGTTLLRANEVQIDLQGHADMLYERTVDRVAMLRVILLIGARSGRPG